MPVLLRERAWFSAGVESVRFLARGQGEIDDFLTSALGVNERGETYLKAGGRAQFIERMQTFALKEGMGPLDPNDRGTLRDITSEGRLGLIFDTQVKAAYDHGYWKQGMEPGVLDAFPAQRFIRVQQVAAPRPYHQAALGTVKLKTDTAFWVSLNHDFGVPWGPWGFNSGCDVEDVDRGEAEGMGLIGKSESLSDLGNRRPDLDFNARLEASTRGLTPRQLRALDTIFGDQVAIEGDRVRWRGNGVEPAQPAPPSLRSNAPLPRAPRVPTPKPGDGVTATPERATREEAQIVNTAKEEAIVYDAAGAILFRQPGAEDLRKVTFAPEDQHRLRDTIVTHNHPGGASFSPSDLVFAMGQDVAELRIIAPSYEGKAKLFRLIRPERGWSLPIDGDTIKRLAAEARVKSKAWASTGGLNRKAARARESHEFMMLLQETEGVRMIYQATDL